MSEDIIYKWVIGKAKPSSDEGKNILSHANLGLGYFIINRERKKSDDIVYAFRWANDRPLPDYLIEADKYQIPKLEAMHQARNIRVGKPSEV